MSTAAENSGNDDIQVNAVYAALETLKQSTGAGTVESSSPSEKDSNDAVLLPVTTEATKMATRSSSKAADSSTSVSSVAAAASAAATKAESAAAASAAAASAAAAKSASAAAAKSAASYFYLGTNGDKQGPFSKKDMDFWLQGGYFPANTMVLSDSEIDFSEIKDHPDFSKAFEVDNTTDRKPSAALLESSSGITKRKIVAKRAVGSASSSVIQIKDAVVRSQFEMLSKKIDTIQKMTAYKSEKQESNNPRFSPILVTLDEIVPRPDEHLEGERRRELPLVTVYKPSHMKDDELGLALEHLGKALQDPKLKKKKNRSFDFKIATSTTQLHELHYGPKKKKAKKTVDSGWV